MSEFTNAQPFGAGTARGANGPVDDALETPLLPTLADNPFLAKKLRESLQTLRDHADPRLRERLTAVLEDRASLRDLARDPSFGDFVGPLADQGWEKFESMSEQERSAAIVSEQEADERTAQERSAADFVREVRDVTSGPKPSAGTW